MDLFFWGPLTGLLGSTSPNPNPHAHSANHENHYVREMCPVQAIVPIWMPVLEILAYSNSSQAPGTWTHHVPKYVG